jgi:hypothetical protein
MSASAATVFEDSFECRPSFGSVTRGGCIKQRQFQPLDFQQSAASDTLQVAVQSGRRFDDAANLFFTLCPQPHHCLTFAVEVDLHFREAFDDGLDSGRNRGPVRYR